MQLVRELPGQSLKSNRGGGNMQNKTTHVAQQPLLRSPCRPDIGAFSHRTLHVNDPFCRYRVNVNSRWVPGPQFLRSTRTKLWVAETSFALHRNTRNVRACAALKQASVVGADYFASDDRPVILFDGVCNL